MTKPQQEFTCVRPFGLSLACGTVMAGCSWAFPWASHLAVTSDARQGENRQWTHAWICCPFTSFLTTVHSTKATSCRTFPIDSSPNGIGGLVVGETLSELEDRNDGETGRIFSSSSFLGKEIVEVRTDEQLTEGVTKLQILIAFGKGGFGNALGVLRN